MTEIKLLEHMKHMGQTSLFYLSHQLLDFKDVNLHTHGEVLDCLESETLRKLLCVPRGCLKSSLACVAYPIHLLLNNPNLRILIDSELFMNSATFLREIKSHLKSPIMTLLYGSFEGSVWNESEIIIKQRTKFRKEASITVGGIGTTKVGQHYDVIISDDLNSPKNTNSVDNAKKVIDHYKYNISILEPDGTYVIIGTRYSELDIIGHVLHNEIGIEGQPRSGVYDSMGLQGVS